MGTKRKSGRSKVHKTYVGGYEVLGRTVDGVQILKPKGRPKSFTVRQLKKAIVIALSRRAK